MAVNSDEVDCQPDQIEKEVESYLAGGVAGAGRRTTG